MTRWLLIIGGGVVLIAIIAAVWFYVGDPKWVAGLIGAAVMAGLQAAYPLVLKLLKPKDFTPEQLRRMQMGLDPFQNPRKRDEKH